MIGIFQIGDRRVADLGEVEAADLARHADGDALVGRDEHVRERCRQEGGLFHRAVVVVHEVDRVAVEVAEELGADGGELGLGVSARGIGHVAGVDLAEVALAVDERVQQRLVSLRQTHHRLIDGGVAVGVEAHCLPDDVRRLRAPAREQAHFIHRVEQLAVRRLEAVDFGDGARDDDAHGIGHVVRVERLGDCLIDHRAAQTHHIRIRRPMDGTFFCFFLCHRNNVLSVVGRSG